MNDPRPKRRHASKWSLVVGLVILVAVAMSCRNGGGDTSPPGTPRASVAVHLASGSTPDAVPANP